MNQEYIKLMNYVNANADLVEQLEKDIKNGNKLSSATVAKLGKCLSAARAVAGLLDAIEQSVEPPKRYN